jgi:predicted nuclease of restriction endonuclease-like RecB superfamily
MLTSEQSIVNYESGRAFADRLTQTAHQHYIVYARQMLSIYAGGVNQQRRVLHRQIEKLFQDEPDCPVRRIAAFCKLLDDKSSYQTDPDGNAAKLRLAVFSKAADSHPLVTQRDRLFEQTESEVKKKIASELGLNWEDIDQNLYADVMEYQRLNEFECYADASSFLARYNVAQLQAAHYKAQAMKIWASEDFKTILRYAKLARLLHEIKRTGPSKYEITLSGPVSVLHESRRYGVNFAKFLPALLACKGWQMLSTIKTPWNTTATLKLTDSDGLNSHLPAPDEFDSSVEESFAKKFGAQREGWQLIREGEILHKNQTTFVPDFVFRHNNGTEVLMEIIGFWTPEYLAHRRETLRIFSNQKILLAIPESSLKKGVALSENLIVYKKAILVKPVMQALEKIQQQKVVSL